MTKRLQIWRKSDIEEGDKDGVYLRLFEEDNNIILRAVDKDGNMLEQGNLLIFNMKKRLVIFPGDVTKKVLMSRDWDGSLLTVKLETIKASLPHYDCSGSSLQAFEIQADDVEGGFKEELLNLLKKAAAKHKIKEETPEGAK